MFQRVMLLMAAAMLLGAELQAGIFSRGGCPNGQCSMASVAQSSSGTSTAVARTSDPARETTVASAEGQPQLRFAAGRTRVLRRYR